MEFFDPSYQIGFDNDRTREFLERAIAINKQKVKWKDFIFGNKWFYFLMGKIDLLKMNHTLDFSYSL